MSLYLASVPFFVGIKFVSTSVATCDPVLNVKTIRDLCYLLTSSGNLIWKMNDSRKTAIRRFEDITHISEKISRCYKRTTVPTPCTWSHVTTLMQRIQFAKNEKQTTTKFIGLISILFIQQRRDGKYAKAAKLLMKSLGEETIIL